jgi:hypothetical protein
MLGGVGPIVSLMRLKDGAAFAVLALCSCGDPNKVSWTVDSYVVGIDDILPIAYQLAQENEEESFVVFFFAESGKLGDDGNLNIQYSIERGKFGLDWVLTSPENVAAKAQVQAFAESKGYIVESRAGNGVDYLRVEDGGSLVTLGRAVITELFAMPESGELGLYFRGIELELQ